MDQKIEDIRLCVERGKVNLASPFPPDMKGREGADELAKRALAEGLPPEALLMACNEGMKGVGEKFGRGEAFVPELLMAAKAMKAVMAHLRPYFGSGQVKKKGTFVIGTVEGDLHDIGKSLVSMVVEGSGWEVVDLGVDVKPAKFIEAIDAHPGCAVGLSALLTTTMASMAKTVGEIKAKYPACRVVVGGAPLTPQAAASMGADAYGADASQAVAALEGMA